MIHLVRHARPALTGVLLGQADPPLAAEVDLAPARLDVKAVFASPLLRARQTAALLFPHHAIEVRGALAEISYGAWDGLAFTEIARRWPALAAAKQQDWFAATPPDGEPWAAFRERVRSVRLELAAAAPCAVVAHAGVHAVLREWATGAPPLDFQQDYGEVITLEL